VKCEGQGYFFFFLSQGCERETKRDKGSSMAFNDRVWCGVVDYLKIITCRVEQGSAWLMNGRDQRGGIEICCFRFVCLNFGLAEVGKVVVVVVVIVMCATG
jgi:hypothetical protein